MSKWYGSVNNRVDENKMFCDEIKVGTGMTEYSYSDREAYEVVEVKDQKHVKVRKLDHKLAGEAFSNNWELISNPNNSVSEIVKRGKYWYWASRWSKKALDNPMIVIIPDKVYKELQEKGKDTCVVYSRANVSFGVADYYYDYEF